MKVFKLLIKNSSCFICSQTILIKNFGQGRMRFKKSFKFYSNDQWLLCREQTRFNMANILYILILNWNIIDKIILIILKNQLLKNYIKSLTTLLVYRPYFLSQTFI